MHRIVLDTNVLVAALRSNLGASSRLLMTIEDQSWKAHISVALALEYEDVLKRGIVGLTGQDVDDFLEYLLSRSNLVPVFFRWRPVLQDADDESYSGGGGARPGGDCYVQQE
jgi:predicted nucleic acid-binding protein